MDPDETLRMLTEAIEDLSNPAVHIEDAASEVREHFADLDRWLRAGGFPPSVWRVS